MACVRSSKMSDGDLLAYLSGDADATITAHLAECHECQQRATVLATQEQHLTTALYRLHCPPSLTLGEYHVGLLSAAETRSLAAHVQRCPHCTHELQMLTTYLTAVAPTIDRTPTPGLVERARILVARLVTDLPTFNHMGALLPGSALAGAGLRGDAGDQLVYAVDDVQVIIDVQTDVQHPAQRTLLGLLLGLSDPQRVTAHLWRVEQALPEHAAGSAKPLDLAVEPNGAQPVATTAVDELGNFIIDALTPGIYDLILSSDKAEVHIQALAV